MVSTVTFFAITFIFSFVCSSAAFYVKEKHTSILLNIGEIFYIIIKFLPFCDINISHWACSNVRDLLNVQKAYKQWRCT
jgi:hypothetical protein